MNKAQVPNPFETVLNLIQECLNLISLLSIRLLKIDEGLISLSNTAEAEGRVQGTDKNRQKHKEQEVAKRQERNSMREEEKPHPKKRGLQRRLCDKENTWSRETEALCNYRDASPEGRIIFTIAHLLTHPHDYNVPRSLSGVMFLQKQTRSRRPQGSRGARNSCETKDTEVYTVSPPPTPSTHSSSLPIANFHLHRPQLACLWPVSPKKG